MRSSKTVTVRGELVEPFSLVKQTFDKLRPNGSFLNVLMKRTTGLSHNQTLVLKKWNFSLMLIKLIARGVFV